MAASAYDVARVPSLEANVRQQCADGTYDLDNNLALLKLYQFHPEKSDSAVVGRVLVKALTRLPASDYLRCTYLIPERVQEEELLAQVAAVAALLETCQFRGVWAALEPLQEPLLQHIPGVADALRDFVVHTLGLTYQAIPAAHVTASLGLDAAAAAKLVEARGWRVEGELVQVALNDDNQAKPRKAAEEGGGALQLGQLTKVMSAAFGLH